MLDATTPFRDNLQFTDHPRLKVKRFIRWELTAISSSRIAYEFSGERTTVGISYPQRQVEALRVSRYSQLYFKPSRSRSDYHRATNRRNERYYGARASSTA
jgi:hypothetical protein